MSIFLPYSPSVVLSFISDKFGLVFSSLTAYESAIITLFANIYFYIYWFIILYFALKIFNRIYERIF